MHGSSEAKAAPITGGAQGRDGKDESWAGVPARAASGPRCESPAPPSAGQDDHHSPAIRLAVGDERPETPIELALRQTRRKRP